MQTSRILLCLAVVGMTALSGCGRAPDAKLAMIEDRAVRVSKVRVAEGTRELRISGVTRASRRATLSFLVSGTLIERPVNLGQTVAQGENIARLFNPSLGPAVHAGEARVRELDARLEQLGRDVTRSTDLRAQRLISEAELERVRTNQHATRAARDLAAAQLVESRQKMAQASLHAPFDGSINAVFFEPGEYVAAGQPVVQVSGDGNLEVELAVTESLISKFSPGSDVDLILPFFEDRVVAGVVIHVGDAGGEQGGLFPVEIELQAAGGDLRPGLTAEARIPIIDKPRMTVPLAAILDPGTGQPRVYVVRNGKIEAVHVDVGRLSGKDVDVAGEIREGDEVVVTGLSSLTPGQSVEILR
jgi:multidrug efflux system membrane fusion protein